MLHIVLYEPQIPPNTGNIIRLMANTGFKLHLIEPLGFNFEQKQLRRAGLDYHDIASVEKHKSYDAFITQYKPKNIYAISKFGTINYCDVGFQKNDVLLFGSETKGLPQSLLNRFIVDEHCLTIPMQVTSRSLNLSNAVAIVSYEAWRQLNFHIVS